MHSQAQEGRLAKLARWPAARTAQAAARRPPAPPGRRGGCDSQPGARLLQRGQPLGGRQVPPQHQGHQRQRRARVRGVLAAQRGQRRQRLPRRAGVRACWEGEGEGTAGLRAAARLPAKGLWQGPGQGWGGARSPVSTSTARRQWQHPLLALAAHATGAAPGGCAGPSVPCSP
jgi:hypothetical protein